MDTLPGIDPKTGQVASAPPGTLPPGSGPQPAPHVPDWWASFPAITQRIFDEFGNDQHGAEITLAMIRGLLWQ